MKLSIFQPWSEFVMGGTLPEEITSKLIELTDIITQDAQKVSFNSELAGEIKDEWGIDIPLLINVGFQPFLFELIKEYIRLVKIQGTPKNTNLECSDETFVNNQSFFKENNWKILTAWFNNQKDNEYSPLHNHDGILSGVLYLKIPEYLPSRKNQGQDGSIIFVGNGTPNNCLFTAQHFGVSPKVGDIFLFPSTLRHEVYPFRTENEQGIRRSMSFNISYLKHPLENMLKMGKWIT